MDQDITTKLGISARFDNESGTIHFNEGAHYLEKWEKTLKENVSSKRPLWKSLKLATAYPREISDLYVPPFEMININPDLPIYWGNRGVYGPETGVFDRITSSRLRFDVTVLSSNSLGKEFLRTEGHQHLSKFPEIYETIIGHNGYLLFKMENEKDVADCFLVISEPGDHIIFPQDYQHISINLGKSPSLMTNWVSLDAQTDFNFIKDHNGAPYWITNKNPKGDFEYNPSYEGKVPQIRVVKPSPEIPTLGLKKGEPMYSLVKTKYLDSIQQFLNDSSGSDWNSMIKGAYIST